mgnify:CR=1 FL=1
MKIALFVHGYLPWDPYGVPRHVQRLASYLADRRHQVYIVTVGRPNLPKIEKKTSNLTIYRTTYIDTPLRRLRPFVSLGSYTLGSLLETSTFIKKKGIQVLHGHTLQWGGLQSALISKVCHTPCVITVHGYGLDKYSGCGMPARLKFLRLADMIICQKTSSARKLLSWGVSAKKIALLTGPVDTRRFRPPEHAKSQPFVVTFIGRLTAFKGPQLLLEAVPYILSKHPSTVIQFVGEGELKEHLIRRAGNLTVLENVKFLGFRNDVDEILRSSHVFVSLSPYENSTDLALLEAMATGLAVVASDVGETRTIVRDGETGLLVKFSPIDLADKISSLLEDRELAHTLSRNGRQLVLKKQSLEIFGKEHEEIYERMIMGT